YVTSDFSVANVVANSHSAKPLLYKISGVWGNHEGSMLLWALILSIFGAAVAIFGVNLPDTLRSRVLAIQALIGVGFLAFLLFTFLVRSRVLTSVHAFAQDPARGMYILGFLLAVTGGGLALYAWRAPRLESGGLYQPVSREGALILNNLLLCTLAATVLLGTLYPLFLDLL